MLDPASLDRIHEASFSILERTGVVFRSDVALDHFRRAGARMAGGRVHFTRELVESALARAPAEYTLRARNPANSIRIGGRACAVMPGGGPPFVRDMDGVRREGRLADVENFARLSALAPEIHVLTRKPVEAMDLPVPVRHLHCWRAILTLADKPTQSGFVNGREEAEDALEMLDIVHGGDGGLAAHARAHCSVNVNSPLTYDLAMAESLMAFAAAGQVVVVSPFVMAGVTGPTTLAGAIAQQNAEVLAGIVLTQLVRPGVPVLYGCASSNIDMRSAAPAIGSPESALCTAVCAQLARRYGLPCRGGGALTDSPVPDAQSHYERTFTLLASVLAGVNFLMHGAGILESYLTISYEQFVIDLEILAMVQRLASALDVSAQTLALDTIDDIGPGGFFLEAEHTLEHYRDAFFMPALSLRQGEPQWRESGARDALARAGERCRQLLDGYREPAMDAGVRARLDDFVERRARELL